jgi:hypothetical protein
MAILMLICKKAQIQKIKKMQVMIISIEPSYAKEIQNISVKLFNTDDIQGQYNFLMGRLRRPIAPDAKRAPIYSVCRSLPVQAHQSGLSRRANPRAPHPGR